MEANSMYDLFPTETKVWLVKFFQSSIQSSSMDLGMVNEDFKINLKPMDCENVCK
jgi:hypothetical protein